MTSPPPRSDNARATPLFSPGLAFRDGVAASANTRASTGVARAVAMGVYRARDVTLDGVTSSANTTASTGVARDVAMGLYRARDVALDGVAASANTTARVCGECSDTRRA